MGSRLRFLPEELLRHIDSFLSFEESMALQEAEEAVEAAVAGSFAFYDVVQVSDDPKECWLMDSKGKKARRVFREGSLSSALPLLGPLKELTLLVKEANPSHPIAHPSTSIRNLTPYTLGGYTGGVFSVVAPFIGPSFTTLSVHADVTLESVKPPAALLPCPIQDLFFGLHYLSSAPFQTLLQISFCCMEFSDQDAVFRTNLVQGMQETLSSISPAGAKTELVVDTPQGYIDMTVELKSLEYSFAFFYYNPYICEPMEEDDEEGEEEVTVEGEEKVLAPLTKPWPPLCGSPRRVLDACS